MFGLKPLAARLLAGRPVNFAVRRIARHAAPETRLRMPLSMPQVEYRQRVGPVLLLDPKVDVVARDIYWGGRRPQSAADALVLRAVEMLCSEGCTFLDIGSYSGLFALVAARSSEATRAIAFEIVPENFLLIWRNIIANGVAGQVRAMLTGIGDEPGSIRMPTRLGLASLATSMSIGSQFSEGIEVPLVMLDSVAGDIAGPLVMKIDVEGFEGAVFRGGAETVRRLRPDIVCEILGSATEFEEIDAFLKPLGYRFLQARADGFHEAERLAPTPECRDWLLSCRPDIMKLTAQAA